MHGSFSLCSSFSHTVLQCGAVRCSVLQQCVAVYCNVLQCVAVTHTHTHAHTCTHMHTYAHTHTHQHTHQHTCAHTHTRHAHTNTQIGRAHVWTPVTSRSRMPSSAWKKKMRGDHGKAFSKELSYGSFFECTGLFWYIHMKKEKYEVNPQSSLRCNTVQRAAIHCFTTQLHRVCGKGKMDIFWNCIYTHAQTLRNTLQHTVTHCNPLQHT